VDATRGERENGESSENWKVGKRTAKRTGKQKSDAVKTASLLYFLMARPTGIEPVRVC